MRRASQSLLAIGALFAACTASLGETPPAARWQTRVRIGVRIFSNAQLPRQDLAEAEHEANTPLYVAGIEILWLDSGPTLGAHETSGSRLLHDLKEFLARALARAESMPHGLSLGMRFSPLPEGARQSLLSGLSYSFAKETTERGDVPWYWTLARALVEQAGDPLSSAPRLTRGAIHIRWLAEDPECVV